MLRMFITSAFLLSLFLLTGFSPRDLSAEHSANAQNFPETSRKLEQDGIMYNKGLYAIEEGKTDKAMTIFQALIAEFPQGRYTSNAKYERARIYRKNGNISKAAQDLKEVIDLPLSRKTVPAMFELAKIYESQKKYSDALGLYKRIIEDHPNSENITVAIHKRNEVNTILLFSKYPASFSFEYTVNPGDSLY
ncbi:tetratricopeptide repeat protein, partial [PVC group bacterium]|nr:tetratricopeptide repeat protein [PVC group bacterium]